MEKNLGKIEYIPNAYPIRPIGVENLPEANKILVDPYQSWVSENNIIAGAALVSPFVVDAVCNYFTEVPLSRRAFLGMMGLAGATAVKIGDNLDILERVFSAMESEYEKNMFSQRTVVKAPELLFYKLYLDTVAKVDYNRRLNQGKRLNLSQVEYSESKSLISLKCGSLHREVTFYGTRSTRALQINQESPYLAESAYHFHRSHPSNIACFLNATSLNALEWAAAIEIKGSTLSPLERRIVYGSESIFIPQGLPENSPVWSHASFLCNNAHPNFTELELRPGNKNQLAVVTNNQGKIEGINNLQLCDWIEQKRLPDNLNYAWLPQFAFNPSEDQVDLNIPFNDTHHRMFSVIATDGEYQYMLAGQPDFYCTPQDLGDIVGFFEESYQTKFKLVACTDVGIAGGFTSASTSGQVYKPNLETLFGTGETLAPFLDHTSSIILSM